MAIRCSAREFAQDHKLQVHRELKDSRQRAYLALLMAVPVTVLAMFEIELPTSMWGRNLSLWIQAVLSGAVVLGLGRQFHVGMHLIHGHRPDAAA